MPKLDLDEYQSSIGLYDQLTLLFAREEMVELHLNGVLFAVAVRPSSPLLCQDRRWRYNELGERTQDPLRG